MDQPTYLHCTEIYVPVRHFKAAVRLDLARTCREVRGLHQMHPTSTIDPSENKNSSQALNPSSTSIRESPEWSSIIVSHATSCERAGAALPDCPFTGYIQARTTVGLSILQLWLDAKWTPVGSKLHSVTQYRFQFLAHDIATAAAFVYFLVRRKPALGIGGGRRMQPKDPEVFFAQRPFGACNVKLPC